MTADPGKGRARGSRRVEAAASARQERDSLRPALRRGEGSPSVHCPVPGHAVRSPDSTARRVEVKAWQPRSLLPGCPSGTRWRPTKSAPSSCRPTPAPPSASAATPPPSRCTPSSTTSSASPTASWRRAVATEPRVVNTPKGLRRAPCLTHRPESGATGRRGGDCSDSLFRSYDAVWTAPRLIAAPAAAGDRAGSASVVARLSPW